MSEHKACEGIYINEIPNILYQLSLGDNMEIDVENIPEYIDDEAQYRDYLTIEKSKLRSYYLSKLYQHAICIHGNNLPVDRVAHIIYEFVNSKKLMDDCLYDNGLIVNNVKIDLSGMS